MPCFHCGTRQTDPDRGVSPWQRGVRHDRQVLICPECQRSARPETELDHCHECGSTELFCRLGEIECRTCGTVRGAAPEPAEVTPTAAGLSVEVEAALDRVLGRRKAR